MAKQKAVDLTPSQKFQIAESNFVEQNRAYEETVKACEHCGGRPGYNPVTGVQLKKGHYSSCVTQQDKRAMVTTYNTSL